MRFRRIVLTTIIFTLLFGPILFANVPYSGNGISTTYNPEQRLSPALQVLAGNTESKWVDVIIEFEGGVQSTYDSILASYKSRGVLQVKSQYSIISACLVHVHSSILPELARNPFVKFVWDDGTCKAADIDISPLIANGGDFFINVSKEINATGFYNAEIPGENCNGSNAVIAILDSGVDITGEVDVGGDLDDFDDNVSTTDPKFLGAVSMLPEDSLYYTDLMGRGTYHAGIACGTGEWNKSYIGVAPGAYYLSVKIFDPVGITYYSIIISGIEWAVSHGADIIFFGGFLPGLYLDPISKALNAASDLGIFVVVPAGDEGPAYMSMDSPGQTMKAICVGAYNSSSGAVADFSSRGPSLDLRTGPDVIAPGVNITGTRAKIFSSSGGTVGALGAFSFNGVNLGGMEVPGYETGGNAGFTLPNGSLATPAYGTEVEENYTRASGTGAAAAVVAGAIALLIQVFPSVTPELMKIALRRTARPITSDENAEGAGLIDVYAAYDYLKQYLTVSSSYTVPLSAPLVYPGAIMSMDSQNYSQTESLLENNWQYWDSAVMASSQAMMTAAVIANGSNSNFSQIFLPLNQFGVSYNLEEVDGGSGSEYLNLGVIDLESLLPNPDNKTFHWFSEFRVLREMHLATDQSIGPEEYRRYASILEYAPLLVVVIVETYDYTIENQSGVYNYTNRVNAFKFNFHFINTGSKPIHNLSLYSFFKADLFLNETDKMSTISEVSSMEEALAFSLDDTLGYDNDTQMLYAIDQDNGTYFNSTYQYQPWGAMGFNSTTHNQSRWEIANSVDLLLNITLNHTQLMNDIHYSNGTDDPGWAMLWNITSQLPANEYETFTGVFGLGFGKTNDTAYTVLKDQMWRISCNVTKYNVTDLVVIDCNTPRIGYLNEKLPVEVRYVNIGNTIVQDTNILFFANRSVEEGGTQWEGFHIPVKNLQPFYILSICREWTPTEEGEYSSGWLGADVRAIYGNANETTILNNYLARKVFIISEAKYNNFADEVMLITPIQLPVKPFLLKHPGDLAILNISIISVRRNDTLQFGYEGQAKSIFFFNQTNINVTNGYGNLVGIALVPLLYASSFMQGNLTLFRSGGSTISKLPVAFEVVENRGRIFFDFAHNNLTITVRNTTIDYGWDERLDSTYGNFYNVREVWSNLTNKGASTMTIPPYLSLNLSEYGLDLGAINSSVPATSLLEKFLGPYSFSSNIISTNTTNQDILQFFDVLVICDPESPFSEYEIANITNWVEAGGHLLVWAENSTENDVNSLNRILTQFNLTISGNNSGVMELTPGNRTAHAIFPNLGSIYLQDPVNFTSIGENASVLSPYSSGPVAVAQRGLGKVVAVGDKDLFNALHLREGNHTGFAENIIYWFFERQFTWDLTTSPSRPIQIPLGEQMYLNLEATGQYAINSSKKTVFLSGFANSSGEAVQVDMMGYKLPVFPLFRSDGYNYVGTFDSLWDNVPGIHYITLYTDAAAFPCEAFIIPVEVLYADPAPAPTIYEFPGPAYPHYLDIIGIIGIAFLSFYLWYWQNEKWQSRLRLTVLKGEVLLEARARVNEARAMLQQVNRELGSDVDELEKIRLLLGNRKRIQKILKGFKKFGDKIGEYY